MCVALVAEIAVGSGGSAGGGNGGGLAIALASIILYRNSVDPIPK